MNGSRSIRRAMAAVALVLSAVAGRTTAQDTAHRHDATVRHRFDDADHWARVFDDPERDAWQKPETVLDLLDVGPGRKVADLGAGTGYFTVRLARRVGSEGTVWAIDVESSLVEHVRRRAEAAGLDRVVPVLAAPDDPRLADASVDLVLIVDTWHHIDSRIAYLGRLRRALRPGGRVAIVDFKPGDIPVGPPPEHRLSRESIVAEFHDAGWDLVREGGDLPYQFVLVFAPARVGGGALQRGEDRP